MSTILRDIAQKNPKSEREVNVLLMECLVKDIHADEMMTFHLVVIRVLIYLLKRIPNS